MSGVKHTFESDVLESSIANVAGYDAEWLLQRIAEGGSFTLWEKANFEETEDESKLEICYFPTDRDLDIAFHVDLEALVKDAEPVMAGYFAHVFRGYAKLLDEIAAKYTAETGDKGDWPEGLVRE